MSSYPVNPRGTTRRRGFSGLLVVLFIVLMGGYFLYNMFPNVFSAVLPDKGGIGGEWVGLVKYQKDMMGGMEQPAAVKIHMKAADLGSIIPTYKLTGELRVAGHTTPITFEGDKIVTGHSIVSLAGFMDQSSDPGLDKANVDGDLKGNRLVGFSLHGMGAGSSSTVKGDLQKGTDADYDSLVKQIQ